MMFAFQKNTIPMFASFIDPVEFQISVPFVHLVHVPGESPIHLRIIRKASFRSFQIKD